MSKGAKRYLSRNNMENKNQNNWRSNLGIATLIFSGILAIAGEVSLRGYFSDWTFISTPVHSAIEIVGAVIGIIMAALILVLWNIKKENQEYLLISAALLSMAILDLFHAFVSPGSLFVWLHSIAMLAGGFFFALVWIPESFFKMKMPALPAIATIGAVIFGIVSIIYPEVAFSMAEEGLMTSAAKNINVAAGILFLIAGVKFMVNYMNQGKSEYVLLANFCLLSAITALFFFMSFLWNADWWFWHIIRLWGFVSVLSIWIITTKDEAVENK